MINPRRIFQYLLAFALCAEASAADFHVSPSGADTNPGTDTAPFATPFRALQAVRAFKVDHPLEGNRIIFHGGIYHFEQTLVLTPEDSGTADAPLTLMAADGEKPVITSARAITGWRQANAATPGLQAVASGHVMEADIPAGWRFHFLHLDGQPQRVAAMSKSDDWHQWPKPTAVGNVGVGGQPLTLPTGLLDGVPTNGDLEMNLMPVNYWNTLSVIRDIDATTHTCRRHSKSPTTFWQNRFGSTDGEFGNFNLQNALKFLTQPGEWCVDSVAGRVWFWPPDDSLVGKLVETPRLQRLMALQGGPLGGSLVSHVEIRGLSFECTDRLPEDQWPDEWVKRQAELPDAMLHLEGVADCVIDGNRFSYSGSYGIALENNSQRVRVTANEIAYPGCGGILLQGYGPGTTDVNRDNVIRRNYIHHTGNGGYLHSAAVTLYQSGGNDISLNWIDSVPYCGIQIAGAGYAEYGPGKVQGAWDSYGGYDAMYKTRWSELQDGTNTTFTRDSFKPYLHSRGNRMSNNIITGFITRMSDGGGLYSWGCGNGNIWENNLLRRDFTNPGEQWCFALYMDDYVDGATLSGNVCWHTSASKTVNKGTNTWTNNTVSSSKPANYDSRLQQIAALAACDGGWPASPINVAMPSTATAPIPADGARLVGFSPSLQWTPISPCHRQDVYFGTDRAAVSAATPTSVEYMGRMDAPTLQVPVTLPENTTCYWRVDQIDRNGVVSTGPVWNFTTAMDDLHADLALHLSMDARDTVSPLVRDLAGPPYEDATSQNGPALTSGVTGDALVFNGSNQSLQTPALNLNSSSATISAWIRRNGSQVNYTGLAYCRGGSTVSGLNFTTGNQIGYTWNNDAGSVYFNSGLVPPDGQWALVALVIAPDHATLWLGTMDGVLKSATNNIPHAMQAFDAPLQVASDPFGGRFFKGGMDELSVWRRTLTSNEVATLLARGRAAATIAPALPREFTWTAANGTGDWSVSSNWIGSAIASGSGNVADFSGITLGSTATVSLDTAITLGGLKFGDPSAEAHSWILNAAAGTPLTMDGPDPLIHVDRAGATLNATLSGSQGLKKTGAGALELTQANNLTGTVEVNEGTLRLTQVNPPSAPVAGTAIWLDAADASTLHADPGNLISAWDNKGSSGGAWSQSDPTRQPSLSSGMLRFGGAHVLVNSSHYSNTSKEIHVFVAARRDSQVTNSGIISLRSSAASSDWNNPSSIILGDRGSTSLANTLSATRNSSDQPLVSLPGSTGNNSTFVVDFHNKSNGSSASWLNGANPRSGTCSGNFAIDRVAIGGRFSSTTPATTSSYWNGRIGEVLVYNRALTNDERLAVEAYLMAKWGVSANTAGSLASVTPVNVRSGGALAGNGVAAGSIAVEQGGVIRPGGIAAVGQLATGPVTMGGTLACRLSGFDCDRLAVTGNLTFLPGATLDVTDLSSGIHAVSYLLATFTGPLNGPLPSVTGMPPSFVLDTSVPGQLRISSAYFSWSADHGLTTTYGSFAADEDGDGTSNLIEFATGGRPSDPQQNGYRHAEFVNSGNSPTIHFTIATRAGAVFQNAPDGACEATLDGIGYRIEASDDLAHWNQPVSEVPAATNLPPAPEGCEYHAFRASIAAGSAPSGFMRLRVAAP